eukprot:970544_1
MSSWKELSSTKSGRIQPQLIPMEDCIWWSTDHHQGEQASESYTGVTNVDCGNVKRNVFAVASSTLRRRAFEGIAWRFWSFDVMLLMDCK